MPLQLTNQYFVLLFLLLTILEFDLKIKSHLNVITNFLKEIIGLVRTKRNLFCTTLYMVKETSIFS